MTNLTTSWNSDRNIDTTMERQVTLRQCPFCGGEAEIKERFIHGVANKKHYHVKCKACGCGQDIHRDYATRGKAIRAWNRRYTELELKR